MVVLKRLYLIPLLGVLASCIYPMGGQGPRTDEGPHRPPVLCAVADCFFSAKAAYQKKEFGQAILFLKSALSGSPQAPWRGRVLLLLARSLEASSNPEAIATYEEALIELPELGDYLLFSLGQLYLARGEVLKSAEVLETLYKRYPSSLLKSQALYQSAEAYFQAGEGDKATERFDLFLQSYPEDSKASMALYFMGKIYLNRNETEKAVNLLKKVVWQYPQDTVAAKAQGDLESLARQGVVIPPMTPTERYQQAKALYRAARYREAAGTFEDSLASGLDPKAREESNLYLGISLVQLRRWPEAVKVFEDLLKNRPGGDIAGEALSWYGRAALRLGDLDKLQWAYQRLKTQYPDRPERARILWYLAFYYESQKEDQKAIQTCRELIQSYPQDSQAPEAYWRIGWIHSKYGRAQEAQKAFDEMLDRYPNTAFRPQVLYWKAKLLERSGDAAKAQEVFGRLCQEHARTYYCHRSRQSEYNPVRWRETDKAPLMLEGRIEPILWEDEPQADLPEALTRDSQYRKAKELMLTEFLEEASRELSLLVGRYSSSRQTLLFLADRLYALGAYDQSLKIVRSYFQETLEKGIPAMPERFWGQAYPAGMVDRITRFMEPDRLSPYLVSAIIREESMYDPKAVSKAGAMGLMQVMPETGSWAANRLGIHPFQPEDLFDKELNIRLGSWYLAHLFEQFKGNLVFTVAAYNAGPEAVTDWIERGEHQDMDEFIEQIPFSETRLYVKKVLRSFYEYLFIYTPQSLPVS